MSDPTKAPKGYYVVAKRKNSKGRVQSGDRCWHDGWDCWASPETNDDPTNSIGTLISDMWAVARRLRGKKGKR